MFVLYGIHLVLYDTVASSVGRYYVRKRPLKHISVPSFLSSLVYSLGKRRLGVAILNLLS
jgi:hypothetical protein